MKKFAFAFVLFAFCGFAHGITVKAGFIVGPLPPIPAEDSFEIVGPIRTWTGFVSNSKQSFHNDLQVYPAETTLAEDPQVYMPLFSNEEITTSYLIAYPNSWMGVYNPSEVFGPAFGNENGNVLWTLAQIIDLDGQLTLDSIRYERLGGPDGFGTTGSYAGTSYENSLTRSVLGYHYGPDGLPGDGGNTPVGTGDDIVYGSGNGTTPVHEIRIFADFGITFEPSTTKNGFGLWLVERNIPGMKNAPLPSAAKNADGQAILDEAIAWLDGFAPFEVTNRFWVEGTNAEGVSTITVNPSGATPEGEPSPTEGEGSVEGFEGEPEGWTLEGEGSVEGTPEGSPEGTLEGEGTIEGAPNGSEGEPSPTEGEGSAEGSPEGQPEGWNEGEPEGFFEGSWEGSSEGNPEGFEGEFEGSVEGAVEQFHSADTNEDLCLDLAELLRVVQLFNIGQFSCNTSPTPTEDNYVLGPGAKSGCDPHNADYDPQDWSVGLSELLRTIQYFSMGGYKSCPSSEDGFCVVQAH